MYWFYPPPTNAFSAMLSLQAAVMHHVYKDGDMQDFFITVLDSFLKKTKQKTFITLLFAGRRLTWLTVVYSTECRLQHIYLMGPFPPLFSKWCHSCVHIAKCLFAFHWLSRNRSNMGQNKKRWLLFSWISFIFKKKNENLMTTHHPFSQETNVKTDLGLNN